MAADAAAVSLAVAVSHGVAVAPDVVASVAVALVAVAHVVIGEHVVTPAVVAPDAPQAADTEDVASVGAWSSDGSYTAEAVVGTHVDAVPPAVVNDAPHEPQADDAAVVTPAVVAAVAPAAVSTVVNESPDQSLADEADAVTSAVAVAPDNVMTAEAGAPVGADALDIDGAQSVPEAEAVTPVVAGTVVSPAVTEAQYESQAAEHVTGQVDAAELVVLAAEVCVLTYDCVLADTLDESQAVQAVDVHSDIGVSALVAFDHTDHTQVVDNAALG